MKPRIPRHDQAISEQAAQWLIELEEAGSESDAAFADWLTASPRHVEEFLLVAAVWREFDGIDPQRRQRIDELIGSLRDGVEQLALEDLPAPKERASRRTAIRWAAAIVGVIGIALTAVVLNTMSPATYATARGEQRAVKLSDGSIVSLNTRSRVEVTYSRHERVLRLIEGEALFTVEHDPSRPFRVFAGATVIQAVGTQFNVYRGNGGGTTVSVVEGVVRILPSAPSTQAAHETVAQVTAGEQADVSADGRIATHAVSDMSGIVAWRERRLVFRGDRLDAIAREFNRYNTLQIRVEGTVTPARRLTGIFDADDPESLLQFFAGDREIRVIRSGDEVLIQGP